MGSVGRRAVSVAALALVMCAAACHAAPDQPPAVLRAGYDTLDGALAVWPARGEWSGDAAVRSAVTRAVRDWRSPTDERVHIPSSGILWLGPLDGAPLALVAADVPGRAASWLLQLSGTRTNFQVTHAAEYADPGYLVYADILPVHVSSGRRYLTSARVERLLGPSGAQVAVADGMSAVVDVPRCATITVTARLRRTQSLPHGRAAERALDLGTAIEDGHYPLVRDDSGSGGKAMDGLDTCALAGKAGPFGSIPQRDPSGEPVDAVPMSWPVGDISIRQLGKVSLGQDPSARLEQLQWHSAAGTMTAMVLRPSAGPPVVSRADRAHALQAYVVPAPGRPLVVLTWQPSLDTALVVPPGPPALVDQPGLVVLPKSPDKQTYSLRMPHTTHYRSVDDPADEPTSETDD